MNPSMQAAMCPVGYAPMQRLDGCFECRELLPMARIGATEPHEWFAIYEYDFGAAIGSGYSFFGWIYVPGSSAHALQNFFRQSLLCHPQSTFVVTDRGGMAL